jgi:HK97 family phage portal protein
MAWWNRKKKKQEEEFRATLEELLLGVVLDDSQISRDQAMSIPALSAGVHLISGTVAALPIKLYKKEGEKVVTIEDDARVKMLNCDTGDTLDAFQFKKSLIADYLMMGGGYAYINRQRNNVKSLHYVVNEQVAIRSNYNPIFKKNTFLVYGAEYQDWEFIKITRNTVDGAQGFGILAENNKMLSVAYNTMIFEDMLFRTGGNKKGFLKATTRLSADAMTALKTAFANLYQNNTENVIVLNNGIEFQEASNNSVELQLQQSKQINMELINRLLNIPVELLNGKATGGNEMLFDSFVKLAILPILKAFETAFNKELLLTTEQGQYYFEFSTQELLKADILKRFQAYDLAVKDGIMQADEIRVIENLEPLGLNFIKLGLQDVLYDVKTRQIYTPNTNKSVVMGEGGTEPQPTEPQPTEPQPTEPQPGEPPKPNIEDQKTA